MMISLFNWRCSRLEKRIMKRKGVLLKLMRKRDDAETAKMSETYLNKLDVDIICLQSAILHDMDHLKAIRGF